MDWRSEDQRGWRGWVGPIVASACVFAILTVVSFINTYLGLIVAALIVAAAVIVLRWRER